MSEEQHPVRLRLVPSDRRVLPHLVGEQDSTVGEQALAAQRVGAKDRGAAPDQGVQRQEPGFAVTVQRPRGMISGRGLPTCVPDPRSRAELAGAARPVRRNKGH
jgi:hypothetical protein